MTVELENLLVGLDLTDLIEAAGADRQVISEAYVDDGVTVVQDTVQGTGLTQFAYRAAGPPLSA